MKQRTVTDDRKREVEELMLTWIPKFSFPRNAAPHNVRFEKYLCEECGEESQEAWAIPHFDWCFTGKLYALLLEESR